MKSIKFFDGDENKLAEEVGKQALNLPIKCKYCGNIGKFSVLSKYQDVSVYREYDNKNELETLHWGADYSYLISCPECMGIHLCKFNSNSENEEGYQNYIENYISSEEEGYFIQEVDYLQTCNFEIIYPQYTDVLLLKDEVIKGVSPSFIEIYNQAQIAEQMNLDKISGMSYRKSLEFLIKDFAIYKNPDDKDTIDDCKYFLNNCINDYYKEMPNIQDCAKRAAWLGNDETHYTQKWKDKDVTDLKNLIQIVLHGIKMDRLAAQYIAEMPNGN